MTSEAPTTLEEFGERVLKVQRREKLGLTQEQMGVRLNSDQTAVWRIEHGAHPRDYTRAEQIIYAYGLDAEQRGLYLSLAFGLVPQDLDSELVLSFTDHLTTLSKARLHGHPLLVIENGGHLAARISAAARKVTPASQPALLRLSAEVRFEQAAASLEAIPEKELSAYLKPIVAALYTIGIACNAEYLGWADFISGDAAYIAGSYLIAVGLITRALTRIKNPDYRLWAMRTLVLAYANLNTPEGDAGVIRTAEEMWKLIKGRQALHPVFVAHSLEGLGRALGRLGKEDAIDVMEQSWRIMTELEHEHVIVPVLTVAWARSATEIMRFVKPPNSRQWQDRIMRGFDLARFLQYPRHVALIEKSF